jgi:hypothetical protein
MLDEQSRHVRFQLWAEGRPVIDACFRYRGFECRG